jgi:GntR family transcriptional repressor for pyruvate dehydrogenase complex
MTDSATSKVPGVAKRPPKRKKISAAAFTRLAPSGGNLVEEVAAQIRDRIEDGVFAKGSRLPSERDLADELGISRTVLRESLRSLESLGYLEARMGQGRFVAEGRASFDSQRALDDWLRHNQTAMQDLVELRAVIESQALRNGTDDPRQLAADLEPLVEAQATALAERRPDDAADIDTEFHLRLAASSPNQPLRSLAIALVLRSRQAAYAAYRVSPYKQGSMRQHRAILAALRAGYRDGAADLLYEHHISRSDQLGAYLDRAGARADGTSGAARVDGRGDGHRGS